MSETNIIPVELKKLVSWRVCHTDGNSRDLLLQKFMAAAMTPRDVTPLDISDVRKTQRRVATLLGQSTPGNEKHRLRNPPSLYYVCRKSYANDDSVWGQDLDSQERELYSTDSTPRKHRDQTAKRALARSSEGGLAGSPASNLVLPPVFKPGPAQEVNEKAAVTSSLTLPSLDPKARLLTERKEPRPNRELDSGGKHQHTKSGSSSNTDLDPNSQPHQDYFLRSNTLESQSTWGSLRVDEDYVPMSVSVRKLTSMDLAKGGTSPYQEFTEIFSSSSSDTLGASREHTLLSAYSDSPSSFITRRHSPKTSYSPSSSVTRRHSPKTSYSRCQCPVEEPSKLLASSARPCPECQLTNGDHYAWCVSRGTVCLHCRRPVSGGWDGQTNLNPALAFGERAKEMSDDALRTIKLTHDAPSRESRRASAQRGQPMREGSLVAETTESCRVRFAETVQEKIISRNSYRALSSRSMSNEISNDESSSGHQCMKQAKKESSDSFTKNTRPSEDIHYLRTQPNIHRDAYLLALKDAHVNLHNKKSKRKKQKGSNRTSENSGLIFSYFPLLKRPHLEGSQEQAINIGIKQDSGRKLKLKNAMKHIFGSIKLGDYYPGGKKYLARY